MMPAHGAPLGEPHGAVFLCHKRVSPTRTGVLALRELSLEFHTPQRSTVFLYLKMDSSHKLSRGKGMLPRSREGVPPLRGIYGRGTPVPAELFTPTGHAELEARQDDHDYSDLISRLHSLSASVSDNSIRRKSGKHGTAISLRANFFELNYSKDVVLYDYKIKIVPDICAGDRDVRRALFYLFERSQELGPFIRGIVHDGAHRLISNTLLPPNCSTTIYFYEDGGGSEPEANRKECIFRLLGPKELKSADLSRYLRGDDPHYCPQPIVSAFNLILTSHAARIAVRAGGRGSYFYSPSAFVPPEAVVPLSANLEAWRGFSATVRPTYKGLMVNVNTGLSAFYVPCARLSDAMIAFSYQTHGATDALTFYGRIKVTTTHLGYHRRSRIKGFGPTPARRTFVYIEEMGGELTVEQYFQQRFGIYLCHADDLPVVNIGTKSKDLFVPAEVCRVDPGQFYSGPLSRNESALLVGRSIKASRATAEIITTQGIRMLGLNHNVHPMASFGIKVSLDMAVVSARVLSPPKVLYQSGQPLIVNGSWTTRGIRFAKPAQLTGVAILVLHNGDTDDFCNDMDSKLRKIVMHFFTRCRSFGMKLDTALPPLYVVSLLRKDPDDPLRWEALSAIEKKLSSITVKPNMIIAFLPNKDRHIYAGLKTICDTKLGISCLCVSTPKIQDEKHQDRYLASLALKLNAKLGGANHILDPGSLQWLKNTMLVGMDVTHLGDGYLNGAPSIAAVVASHDMDFVHYPASLSIQEHKKEMIMDVKHMVVERLNDYIRHMNALPERIVIFRGGVSDSQIKKVLESELSGIRAAFCGFKDYKPKLTFLICGKGHHTRFYPMKEQDADKSLNVRAGTVVDQEGMNGIYDFSFYLQTHAATQNTARNTRYTVLIDENKFSTDDLQQGINDLSYLWAPAPRSVSLIPPAYWADRACKHARLYLHAIMHSVGESKESMMDEKEVAMRARALWGNGVHDEVKSTMFYL